MKLSMLVAEYVYEKEYCDVKMKTQPTYTAI